MMRQAMLFLILFTTTSKIKLQEGNDWKLVVASLRGFNGIKMPFWNQNKVRDDHSDLREDHKFYQ